MLFVVPCSELDNHSLLIACLCLSPRLFSLFQLLDWHLQLDRSLPAPLDKVGAWLHEAEGALRQEIIVHQAHDVTANTVHRALEQHKVGTEPWTEEANSRKKRQLGAGQSGVIVQFIF